MTRRRPPTTVRTTLLIRNSLLAGELSACWSWPIERSGEALLERPMDGPGGATLGGQSVALSGLQLSVPDVWIAGFQHVPVGP